MPPENVKAPKLADNKPVYNTVTVKKEFKVPSKKGINKFDILSSVILVQAHARNTPHWMYRQMKKSFNEMRPAYFGIKSQDIK